MKPESILEILVRHGAARKEGAAVMVPSDHDTTIYVAFEGETLAVPRITRAEIDGGLFIADTAKGERFVVMADDVRGVKIERSEVPKRDARAGFGK